MNKKRLSAFCILLLSLLSTLTADAQEMIWVKCNGKLEQQMVPSKEKCGCKSWHQDYYRADNPSKAWGSTTDDSYAAVEKETERLIKNEGAIPTSNNVYHLHSVIYCNDYKMCGPKDSARSDMQNKLSTILDNYRNSLIGAVAEIKGLPNWTTNPGMILLEYINLLQDRLAALKNLKTFMDNIASMSLDQIQDKIDEETKLNNEIPDILRKAHAESDKIMKNCNGGHCPTGYVCTNGTCVPDKPKPVAPAVEMRITCSGSDCPPGYTCRGGFCVNNNPKAVQNNVAAKSPSPSTMKVTCSGSDCPPGYDCRGGFCVILTKAQKDAEAAQAKAEEQAKIAAEKLRQQKEAQEIRQTPSKWAYAMFTCQGRNSLDIIAFSNVFSTSRYGSLGNNEAALIAKITEDFKAKINSQYGSGASQCNDNYDVFLYNANDVAKDRSDRIKDKQEDKSDGAGNAGIPYTYQIVEVNWP